MAAVLLNAHSDIEKLSYRNNVAVPVAGSGEVLIRLAAIQQAKRHGAAIIAVAGA